MRQQFNVQKCDVVRANSCFIASTAARNARIKTHNARHSRLRSYLYTYGPITVLEYRQLRFLIAVSIKSPSGDRERVMSDDSSIHVISKKQKTNEEANFCVKVEKEANLCRSSARPQGQALTSIT